MTVAVKVSFTTSPPCSGVAVGCEALSEAVRMSERMTKPICSLYSTIAQVPFTAIRRTAVPALRMP